MEDQDVEYDSITDLGVAIPEEDETRGLALPPSLAGRLAGEAGSECSLYGACRSDRRSRGPG